MCTQSQTPLEPPHTPSRHQQGHSTTQRDAKSHSQTVTMESVAAVAAAAAAAAASVAWYVVAAAIPFRRIGAAGRGGVVSFKGDLPAVIGLYSRLLHAASLIVFNLA
jgi:hypothetical protein